MAPLAPAEMPAAIGVLARGMRDNPIHVAALGGDADRRERMLRGMFTSMWRHMDQHALCARRDGELVGVCGRLPPGGCRPTPAQGLRMAPAIARPMGRARCVRMMRWVGAWSKRDPGERHEHLGPVAVDRHLQGQGIGSAMLAAHAEDLDVRG